jgi:precorrin-6B C5,15-methyltransferase / cobalt-precorrin-6B C5,C15-methyltransferase
MDKVQILGIGDDGIEGLTPAAKTLIEQAELLIGSRPTLALAPHGRAERIEVGGDLDSVVKRIEAAGGKRVVVLASGDPLFYGTARYLCDRLGKDRFDVVPHVSSMQLAFARVKESWDDAYLMNLATQPIEQAVERVRSATKVGLFTTERHSPTSIARALLERKIDYFTAYVCENLGAPDERVTHAELAEVANQEFSPLNVMILVRKPSVPDRPATMIGRRLFGNPDEMFLQSKPKHGLLTPAEVRAIALAELDLGPTSTVWDVGAGSGSVAVEAAMIATGGAVFAIEMDPEDYGLIASNAERFGASSLTPILGRAPEAWERLPKPDAIFVGGSGRHISKLVELAFDQLKPGGRIVANLGSVENLAAVREVLQRKAGDMKTLMVNLARGHDQLGSYRFEAMNPTFVLSATKQDQSSRAKSP